MTIKVPATGPIPARYLIVGEAPGADEERLGKPFVGKSGWLLDSILGEVGIPRNACFITNVCKYRPPDNKLEGKTHAWLTETKGKANKFNCCHFSDGFYYNNLVAEGLHELDREITTVRPDVIIALGGAALWATTGENGIAKWRGSEMWWKQAPLEWGFSIPVVPTYHPAYVLRMWEWKAIVTHDLRVRVVGKMNAPASRETPSYNFTVAERQTVAEDSLVSLLSLLDAGVVRDVTCDVETRHRRIACVGFGWSDLDALCIPVMHVDGSRYWPEATERELCWLIKRIMDHSSTRLINQNFNYDRQYFVRDSVFGFRPRLHYDTMIGQHLLFPGTPKDLAHQSSLYCKWHRYWKDEGKEIETTDERKWWEYNCRDCVATWEIARVTRPMLIKAGFAQEGL